MSDEISASSQEDAGAPVRDPAKTAMFHLQKANLFRVVHVDGVWCSRTPKGLVQMMFFNERLPIPEQTFHDIIGGGVLGPEQLEKRIGKSGYIREVEFSAVVDKSVLYAMRDWIDNYLAESQNVPKDVSSNQ